MNDIAWLFYANAIFWIALCAYTLWLGLGQRKLQREIRQIKILQEDEDE